MGPYARAHWRVFFMCGLGEDPEGRSNVFVRIYLRYFSSCDMERTIYDTKPDHSKTSRGFHRLIFFQPCLQGIHCVFRQPPLMFHNFVPTTTLAHEAAGCGENAFPPLPGLHRPSHKALPFPYTLDMVKNRDGRVAR